MSLTTISFFERFEADILSGKKTITIRDELEKDFIKDSIVQVSVYETGRWFCEFRIKGVEPILIDELSDFHAIQENMTLSELKAVIGEIYPNVQNLYVISYELL